MQNTVKTPVRKTQIDKKVHTPPSVEHDTGRPKLLKSFSGKVFRRASLKSHQSATLDSMDLFAAGGSMSNKRSTPKPLIFKQPLSPPPTVRRKREVSPTGSPGSFRVEKLDSPIHILSPEKSRGSRSAGIKPINLLPSLKHDAFRSASSSKNHPIIWTDTVEDPYLEENSPTYLRSVSRNVSSISSSAGRRRFVFEKCSMCAEGMSSIFPGETIVQMTCSHASHYECYLAMYEPVYMKGGWPECRDCHKISKPADPDVIQKMTSTLLTRRQSTDSFIEQHLMSARMPGSFSGPMFDFTPRDQLITSADVFSDGFKTPLRITRTNTNYENSDTELSCRSLVGPGVLLEDKLLSSVAENESFSQRESTSGSEEESNEQDLRIEINPLSDSHLNKAYAVVAEIPNEPHHKCCCSQKARHNTQTAEKKKTLKLQVEAFVKKKVGQGDEVGFLSMFDQIGYSTDGEHWNNNTLVCFFEKSLVLFDVFEVKIVGKIPVEQICNVNRLSENSLIIDLKSRTLPEMYFSLPLVQDSALEKWKYYLMHPEREPDWEHMTDTAWHMLPNGMAPATIGFIAKPLFCGKCVKPWEHGIEDVPLQVIVCLSLSSNERQDSVAYQRRIVQGLRKLLECLNERDLFGLVTGGRNGSGSIGEFGSFIGTMSKTWSSWGEFLDSLEVVERQAFQTPLKEFNKVWETCYRLVSTSSFLLDDGDREKFFKQIIFMTDDPEVQGTNKYEDIITQNYHFDVMRVPSYHSEDCDFSSIISNLHKKSIKALEVKLPSGVLKFGNMAPGEKKTLTAHLDTLRIPRNEGMPAIEGTKRAIQNATIDLEVQWFNLKTASEKKMHKSLKMPVSRP